MNAIARGRLFVCLSIALATTALATTTLAQKPKAVTDPKDADADFALQGEYVGKRGGEDVGAQVVALGGGKFDLVLYAGGLPGAGWKAGDKKEKLSGAAADGVVNFSAGDQKASLKDGVLTLADGSLKKTERQSPTLGKKPPEGARVLFDGETNEFGGAAVTAEKLLPVSQKLKTPLEGNFTLHIEFRTPYQPTARGQGRGNSGVYLGGNEVQVLDSFGLEGKNNECGGLYGKKAPDVNMCLPPLAWQTFDVEYTAPQDGRKARMTVRHNGVVVHDNVELGGGDKTGVNLQNHGNPVVYRNIWAVTSK